MAKDELLKVAKPIFFTNNEVRAVLDDRKSQVRKVMKPQPVFNGRLWKWHTGAWSGNNTPIFMHGHGMYNRMPVHLSDILYVQETLYCSQTHGGWRYIDEIGSNSPILSSWKKVSPTQMPKEAVRIFLQVTGVRAEQLREISEKDAEFEGAFKTKEDDIGFWTFRRGYETLWNSNYAKRNGRQYAWDKNPWVWVYEFERMRVSENK